MGPLQRWKSLRSKDIRIRHVIFGRASDPARYGRQPHRSAHDRLQARHSGQLVVSNNCGSNLMRQPFELAIMQSEAPPPQTVTAVTAGRGATLPPSHVRRTTSTMFHAQTA